MDPGRWVDGWLHTKDAGIVDPSSGLVTVRGRLDAQVSIGGLKVDLMEVEQSVSELPGVTEAVVVYDRGIEAYLVVDESTTVPQIEDALATRLAPYKVPKRLNVVSTLPRTVTGKLVRELASLRESDGVAVDAAR